MANRTISLITYATDGSVNTTVTPTVTVSYAGAAASALTPTANGSYWNVTIDDTQDATILVSGDGLVSDHLVFPRIPTDQLAEPSDIPTDYATATAVAAIPTTPLLAANYTAPPSAAAIATAVWGNATRTLSSFGTLVADVWASATRSLTDKAGFSATATNMRGTDNAMLAASYTAPPSAASIASAVRSNLTAELATITSTGALATLLAKHARNKMTKVDNGNGTMTVTIFDDDGTTPLLTYLYTSATDTRSKAV